MVDNDTTTSARPDRAHATSTQHDGGVMGEDERVNGTQLSTVDNSDGPAPPDAAQRPDAQTQPTDGQLAPGDLPNPDPVTLWPSGSVDALRERWRAVQLGFVDDPAGAVADADGLVSEAMQTLTEAMAKQRTELAGWRQDDGGDTERLRLAVQRYRQFIDRVLAL